MPSPNAGSDRQGMARTVIDAGQIAALAKAADYNVTSLAEQCGMSPRQLRRLFRRQFARSLKSWLTETRIEKAEYLLQSQTSVKAVAFALGYKQPSHFFRQFKDRKLLTPSEFALIARSGAAHVAPTGSEGKAYTRV